ncbi:MAG: substrate-binding domain-containing protein [Anaerolineales bacterium]|nr:substrate-binding domain-containing protein [Anaerolineales bacterium]
MSPIKYRVYLVIVLALAVSALIGLTPVAAPVSPAQAQEATAEATEGAMAPAFKILAVEKTLINEHWQIMQKGYEWAAKRYNVAIDVVSVPTEADTAAQLDLVESALAKGYDGIAVSPISPNNLNPALAKASEMGIPIVNVDELIPKTWPKTPVSTSTPASPPTTTMPGSSPPSTCSTTCPQALRSPSSKASPATPPAPPAAMALSKPSKPAALSKSWLTSPPTGIGPKPTPSPPTSSRPIPT